MKMPDRLVRDELLTSERYWSVSPEARNLFLSFVLSADDTARCPASNFVIRTKFMAGTVSPERAEKLLAELQDIDLVRVYEHDAARFVFIPRFRQRLRYINSAYPEPPSGISDLIPNKTDPRQTQDKPESVRSEEKLREVKRSKEKHIHASAGADAAFVKFWDAYPRKINQDGAWAEWKSLSPSGELQNVMLLALDAQMKSGQWVEMRYIPSPAKWIKERRWMVAAVTAADIGQCEWNQHGNRDSYTGRCEKPARERVGRNAYCEDHAHRSKAFT